MIRIQRSNLRHIDRNIFSGGILSAIRNTHEATGAAMTIRGRFFSSLKRPKRHSGLQKEVLSLYRSLLRRAKTLGQGNVVNVRKTFRRDALSIPRTDIRRIEHYLRRGNKLLRDSQTFNATSIKII